MSRPDVVYVALSGETLVAEQQQMPQIRNKYTHALQYKTIQKKKIRPL